MEKRSPFQRNSEKNVEAKMAKEIVKNHENVVENPPGTTPAAGNGPIWGPDRKKGEKRGFAES